MSDRRNVSRQKSLLRGFVYFDNSPSAVECVVRDISETGARLKFQNFPAIADTLELHVPVKGQKFRANVEWHEDGEIGIAFFDASEPSNAAPPAGELFARMNRLEAEIAGLKKLVNRLQQNASHSAA